MAEAMTPKIVTMPEMVMVATIPMAITVMPPVAVPIAVTAPVPAAEFPLVESVHAEAVMDPAVETELDNDTAAGVVPGVRRRSSQYEPRNSRGHHGLQQTLPAHDASLLRHRMPDLPLPRLYTPESLNAG
jgi:hypothetical protein